MLVPAWYHFEAEVTYHEPGAKSREHEEEADGPRDVVKDPVKGNHIENDNVGHLGEPAWSHGTGCEIRHCSNAQQIDEKIDEIYEKVMLNGLLWVEEGKVRRSSGRKFVDRKARR